MFLKNLVPSWWCRHKWRHLRKSIPFVCIWNFSLSGPKVYLFTTLGAFMWSRHLLELASQFPGIATRKLSTWSPRGGCQKSIFDKKWRHRRLKFYTQVCFTILKKIPESKWWRHCYVRWHQSTNYEAINLVVANTSYKFLSFKNKMSYILHRLA